MASISEKMVEALSSQINAEIYSACLYHSMAGESGDWTVYSSARGARRWFCDGSYAGV